MFRPPRDRRSPRRPVSRRAFLASLGATSVTALSGCSARALGDDPRSRSAPAPTALSESWPTPRHDRYNTGRADGPGPGASAGLAWEHEWPEGYGWPRDEPVLAGDTLYVPDDREGTLTALDATDGSVRWRVGDELAGWEAADPTVADDLVLFGHGNVLRAYGHDGSQRWTTAELAGQVTGTTIHGDTAYVATADGVPGVYAVALADGAIEWRTGTGLVQAVPAVTDDSVLVGDMDGRIRRLDRETGEEVGRFPVADNWTQSAPLVHEGTVYAASGTADLDRGHVHAFDLGGGERWRHELPETAVKSSMALGGDALYAAGFDGTLLALDPGTGEERWSFSPGGWFADDGGSVYADDSPVVAGGHIYYTGGGTRLYAVPTDPKRSLLGDVEPSWSADVGDPFAPPIVVDEYLFVASERGVSCFGPA